MNTQKRTPEAIAQDVNLLVRLGWKRDQTPPYHEGYLFFQKDGKTAIVTTETVWKDYLDNPVFEQKMFDENGDYKYSDFINPLPF